MKDVFLFCQSYSERHVSLGTFGEQLLNKKHKIMKIATLDVEVRLLQQVALAGCRLASILPNDNIVKFIFGYECLHVLVLSML